MDRRIAPLMAALVLTSTIASGAALALTPAPVASHGSRSGPVVALTFDDGSSAANCRRIVSILEARQVPATFFPAAKWARLDPLFWRWVASLGFPIGNHTTTHQLLGGQSLAAQAAEIATGVRDLEAIVGGPIIPVLRPPGGSWDANTPIAAASAGERLVLLWDTTFADTSHDPVPAHYIVRATEGRDGSVLLAHCGPSITPEILGTVIDAYRARGFRFVTVPQLFGLPGPTPSFAAAASPPPLPSAWPSGSPDISDPASPAAPPSASPSARAPSATPITGGAPGPLPPAGGGTASDLPAAAVLGGAGSVAVLALLALLFVGVRRRQGRPGRSI